MAKTISDPLGKRIIGGERFRVIKDTEAPTVGSKAINVTNITSDSITITWERATDNVTAMGDIRYQVGLVEDNNPQDSWRVVCDERGINSYTFTGLKPSTTYAFFVKAYDRRGNVLQYPLDNGCMTATTSNRVRPMPGRPSAGTSTGTDTGPDTTGPITDDQRRQQIRNYFNLQRSRDKITDVMVSMIEKQPRKYIVSGQQAMMLINETHNIYNSKDDFMPINEAGIYPGRLIYADKDLVNGRPSDVNFYVANQTGKVTVNVNFLATNVALSEKGVTADYASVQAAIGRILSRALASGALPPTNVESTTTTSNSKEKIAIDAGCSVDYLGAKCKIDTSTTKNQESFYQMESFKQGFYQVSVEPEDRDSVNYLGEGVTVENVRQAREKAPLAIIKSVTYGRVGYNIKKYDASSFNFNGSQSASYKSYVEATGKEDIEKSSNASTHFARIWGGSATTAGKALIAGRSTNNNKSESEKIDKDFTTEMTSNMEVNMKNQGVPISFTVVYLASGREVGAYLTGKYVESKYVPLVNKLSLEMTNSASTLLGTECIQCVYSYKYIQLDSMGNVVKEGSDWGMHKWSQKNTYYTNIELPQGCYFKDNKLTIKLESGRAAGVKMKKGCEGSLNVTGGKLKIQIEGSYYYYDLHLGGDNTCAHF